MPRTGPRTKILQKCCGSFSPTFHKKECRNVQLKAPTLKQRKTIKLMLDNPNMSAHRAMLEAGYSESSSANPQLITQSPAFKKEMAKHGLTEELIATALVDDIKHKKRDRVAEMRLGANILQMTNHDEGVKVGVQVNINQDREEFS